MWMWSIRRSDTSHIQTCQQPGKQIQLHPINSLVPDANSLLLQPEDSLPHGGRSRMWWGVSDGGSMKRRDGSLHEGSPNLRVGVLLESESSRGEWVEDASSLPSLSSVSVALSLSLLHTHTLTLLPPALLQIALHWWNFNGSFRKNNEHASPWSCVHVCVRGCFRTSQSYGGMQQTRTSARRAQAWFAFLFTHIHLSIHPLAQIHFCSQPTPFFFSFLRHIEKHTQTYSEQASTEQHQTRLLTDTHTHTHSPCHTGGAGRGEQTERSNPSSKRSPGARTHRHTPQ